MNKPRENAMRHRETAVVKSFRRGIDVMTGDTVQVRPPGHNSGRIGKVIGITYYDNIGDLRFTIQFGDGDAAIFSGERLTIVRPAKD